MTPELEKAFAEATKVAEAANAQIKASIASANAAIEGAKSVQVSDEALARIRENAAEKISGAK